MKCVIPCAGKGTRINSDVPKVLLKVNGRSLLGHITYEWSGCVDGFVIIVSGENESLIRQNSGKAEFVIQDPLRGIADAILQAEPYVEGRFIVALGDCLHKGTFIATSDSRRREGMSETLGFDLGIGVWRVLNEEYWKSYAVLTRGLGVTKVIEKPQVMHKCWYCGMGTYFFDQRVFDYIRKALPSALRNEVEITDVIQNMIDAGERVTPVWFDGKYINITHPEDIKKAEEVLK